MQLKFLLIFIAVAATGCAGTQQRNDAGGVAEVNITNPAQDRVFLVSKQTPTGKLVERRAITFGLLKSLREKISKATLESKENGSIEASWKWALALNKSYLTASFPVRIEDVGIQYRVTLQCPISMTSEIKDYSITGIPKWNNEKIGQNVSAACASAVLNIPFSEELKGEINSGFNDVSVFSNYRRKLKTASDEVWKNYRKETAVTALDIVKAERFFVNSPAGDSLASVIVFPYRNGAKVSYAFVYNYLVKGDGTTTYRQSDIETIKKSLADIAND